MTFDLAKQFIDNLLKNKYSICTTDNTKTIILDFIGGEPLLQIELIEQTRAFLEARVNETPVYGEYINAWERVENFLKSNDEISKLVAFSRLD